MIASVLWPVTFAVCVYVGMFSYIAYQIYNIVKIVSLTRMCQKINEVNM